MIIINGVKYSGNNIVIKVEGNIDIETLRVDCCDKIMVNGDLLQKLANLVLFLQVLHFQKKKDFHFFVELELSKKISPSRIIRQNLTS